MYATWDMVAGRYPDAAKIYGADGVGSYWLDHAAAEIDARLALRYTVPFTPTPLLIQDLCVDLTYWKMTMRQKSSEALGAYIENRLDALATGSMSLVMSGAVLPSIADMPYSNTEQFGSSFGVDDPLNWSVDSNYMQMVDRGEY